MLFNRRRMTNVQFVLLGVLFGSSVYLWTKKNTPIDHHGQALIQEATTAREMTVTFDDNSILPIADPLSISPYADNPTEINRVSYPLPIEPFPSIPADAIDFTDLNRTLAWLDLWKGDEACTKHQVHLLKPGSQPKPGALVSFPGSGNSWLRMLLMGITGVFTSSVYAGDDAAFQSKANTSYQLPIDCNCTLLQKTHDFSLDWSLYNMSEANKTKTINSFDGKGILIIRNPFKAIRSYRNFEFNGLMGVAPESVFQGERWDGFVSRSVAGWETLATVWIRGLKKGGVIYYEKLRHETGSELKRLVTMLGLSYDQEKFNCVLKHTSDNSFKRESPTKSIENPYTASQRLLIHKAIDNVQTLLKERGLEPLPVQYYDQYNDLPEYGEQQA